MFYYSVRTTGVYCLPSCASRLANPKNVNFHLTPEDAEQAGFRPCKRCRPYQSSQKRLGTADIVEFAVVASSLGEILVARSARGLCAVLFGDDLGSMPSDLQRRFPGATLVEGGSETRALADRVVAYMESPTSRLDIPLDMRGTEFQRAVWQALCEIPAGATASYADIANRLGMPRASRAVAQACAANPLSVVVPCHRVIRADGSLSGYYWGVARKRALLEREASI
jgi:AraC family transcriptional regulator of adaptative response/methylated-DNA-[protein]-cysteine methyltransferase